MPISTRIQAEIEERLGYLPPWFKPACATPELLKSLWQQTCCAYLDNPLPALLKERLFAYLSRYCSVPYCLILHSCRLWNLGVPGNEIFKLLTTAAPTDLDCQKSGDKEEHFSPIVLTSEFQLNPELEQSIWSNAVVLFLEPSQAQVCRDRLRSCLDSTSYNYLVLLLGYIKLCHQWIENDPELSIEDDIWINRYWQSLVQESPQLAEFLTTYRQYLHHEAEHHQAQLTAQVIKLQQLEQELRSTNQSLQAQIAEREQREAELQLLESISYAIATAPNLESALNEVLSRVCQVTGWNYAEVWIADLETPIVQLSSAWYHTHPILNKFRQVSENFTFTPSHGIPGRLLIHCQPEWMSHLHQQPPEVFYRVQSAQEVGLKTALGIPIIADGKAIAVFVFMSFEDLAPDQRLINLMVSIANQIALLISRKRAIDALFESEQRLAGIFNQAQVGIAQLNLEGQWLIVNQKLCQILGYEVDQLKQSRFQDLICQKTRQEFDHCCAQLLSGELSSSSQQICYQHQNGSTVWVNLSTSVVREESGAAKYLLVVVEDITDRKQAESELESTLESLQQERSQLKAILQQMPAGAIVVEASTGSLMLANSQAEKILQKPLLANSKTLLPNECKGFYLDGRSYSWEELPLIRTLQTGIPVIQEEMMILRGDGSYVTISVSAAPIRNASGAIAAGVIVIQDITEQHRLHEQLEERVQERTAQLEEANQELQAFCYSVSHDLRAPLRGIDGFSQALLERYEHQLDNRGHHYLHRIRANTKRLGELIDDLLELSRVSRTQLHWMNVNLSELAADIALELDSREPDRRVVWEIQPGLHTLGDRNLLRIVLENLLHNAWKYTSRRTEAYIALSAVDLGDDKIAFCVSDNGAGFDQRFADKLFQPFQRLHGDDEFPGAGIGLATVGRIMRRHRGAVWALGEIDRGAQFYFACNFTPSEAFWPKIATDL